MHLRFQSRAILEICHLSKSYINEMACLFNEKVCVHLLTLNDFLVPMRNDCCGDGDADRKALSCSLRTSLTVVRWQCVVLMAAAIQSFYGSH